MINPFKLLPIAMFIVFLACHSKGRPSESKDISLTASDSKDGLMVSSKKDHATIRRSISMDTMPAASVILDTSLYPLLPHLAGQQVILRKYSQKGTDHQFVPDGKYTNGNFDQGVIDLIINNIDGEPRYIYGQLEAGGDELEFLVYGMKAEQVDQYKEGQTYRIYWAETICYMEPFDEGYQRCYIVYRVEH